jgi:hypothetical protein
MANDINELQNLRDEMGRLYQEIFNNPESREKVSNLGKKAVNKFLVLFNRLGPDSHKSEQVRKLLGATAQVVTDLNFELMQANDPQLILPFVDYDEARQQLVPAKQAPPEINISPDLPSITVTQGVGPVSVPASDTTKKEMAKTFLPSIPRGVAAAGEEPSAEERRGFKFRTRIK